MSLLEQFTQNQSASAEVAARIWWHWRHHYLEAMHNPKDKDELLAILDSDELDFFDRVYRSRLTGARMVNPTNAALEDELLAHLTADADNGLVPLGDGEIQLDPVPHLNPFEVGLDAGPSFQIPTLSTRSRYGIVGVAFVGLLLTFWLLFRPDPVAVAEPAMPTLAAVPPPAAAPTPAPSPTAWTIDPADPLPAFGVGVQELLHPTSLEIGEQVYAIQTTRVKDGAWELIPDPGVASWLAGSTINVVLYLQDMPAIDVATALSVRDSSGVVRTYIHPHTATIKRHRIEVLAQQTVGLTLIAAPRGHPGDSPERTIITAQYAPMEDSHD